jgi:hypothetical protein
VSGEVNATYTEGLQVVQGDGVAVEVEEGILEHATMPVAEASFVSPSSTSPMNESARVVVGDTYERTKRSRLSQSGFLGLKRMNLLKRTWAMGAMPLDSG